MWRMTFGKFCSVLLVGILAVGAVARAGEMRTEPVMFEYPDKAIPRYSVGVSGGTQGIGVSVGYQVSERVRVRLRGAYLGYDSSEQWGSMDSRIQIHGNNAGMLIDFFPFGEHFYISAGLNLCESEAEYRAHFRQKPGLQNRVHFGGRDYKMTDGDHACISGDYTWNKLQPYIGIGYQDYVFDLPWLMYSIEMGICYMGQGEMSVQACGGLKSRDPETYQWEPITPAELEQGIRQEGKDFFDLADGLRFYPVLQMSISAVF